MMVVRQDGVDDRDAFVMQLVLSSSLTGWGGRSGAGLCMTACAVGRMCNESPKFQAVHTQESL